MLVGSIAAIAGGLDRRWWRPSRGGAAPGQHPNSVQAPPQRVAGCLYDAHSNSVALRSTASACECAACRATAAPSRSVGRTRAAPLDDDDEDEERKEAETRGVRLNAGAQSFSRDPEGLAALAEGPAARGGPAAVSSRAVRDADAARGVKAQATDVATLEVVPFDDKPPARVARARRPWVEFDEDRESASAPFGQVSRRPGSKLGGAGATSP